MISFNTHICRLRYHKLKFDEKSYLTTFACQFGRNKYMRLPFGASPAGHVFQIKMGKIFKDSPNADDILIVG